MTTDTAPGGATPADKPGLVTVMLRRTLIALVLIVLILVPTVVLFVITKQPSATYASMGGLIGILAVLAGDRRVGVITAVVVSLLAPISIVAGLSPVTGAALMAIMTLTVGRLSIFGLHRATMLVPILLAWTILSPVPWLPASLVAEVKAKLAASGMTVTEAIARAQSGTGSSSTSSSMSTTITKALVSMRMDSTYLGWIALFFFVGTIVPVIVLPLLTRKLAMPKPTPHPRSEAVPYTIIITVLTAGATYYCLEHSKLVAGSFLIATILVLTQIGNDIRWKITVERVLGTLGGVLLLAGIIQLVGGATYVSVLGIPMPMTYYGIGMVAGALAVIAKFSPQQWIYYILITPTAALLNAFTTGQATDFGKQRLVDNVVGAGLVIVATLVTLVAGRVMQGRVTIAPALDVPDASPV